MDKFEAYCDTLRRAGLRLTQQRRMVLTYLAETDAHPTPYRVYEEISQHHPEISRATVYNTLNTLQQLGAIVEMSFGADHTHYDTNPRPHVNLICLRCHKIADLELDEQFQQIRGALGAEQGFHALVARAEVLGLCAGCYAAQQVLTEVVLSAETKVAPTIDANTSDETQIHPHGEGSTP